MKIIKEMTQLNCKVDLKLKKANATFKESYTWLNSVVLNCEVEKLELRRGGTGTLELRTTPGTLTRPRLYC